LERKIVSSDHVVSKISCKDKEGVHEFAIGQQSIAVGHDVQMQWFSVAEIYKSPVPSQGDRRLMV
jgi:hypothetical protein